MDIAMSPSNCTNAAQLKADRYDLWVANYSLPCLMIRFTFACLQALLPAAESPIIKQHDIDLVVDHEQLSESFLLTVNPKGQVPVLASDSGLEQPLTESLDMGLFLTERYGVLRAPPAHVDQTVWLLRELHTLDYFALTFARTAMGFRITRRTLDTMRKRLDSPDLSPAYRKALLHKYQVYKSEKGQSFDPLQAARETDKASKFLTKLTEQMDEEGPWIWGKSGPCILDAHVVPFLLRIKDANCGIPLTARLNRYVGIAEASSEWQGMMQGMRTLPLAPH
ncbi:hypothetical protein N7447_008861 [Penicillium robsamsonii]|uniref:uncharacterized protein n=1 Tax=Penicillium robsamsonii TaxID=1792511 RepID=UPI002547BEEC|nr:uncharacterized protein N7447_008861 [Penicillium robsamsonii]KAJ5816628.1 hypothetical protein N7447_008861 [Penicillium robsamsonii]